MNPDAADLRCNLTIMTMSRERIIPKQGAATASPLSIEQLEAGLRLLDRDDTDCDAFWDDHIDAFRRTVLFAIRETSDALLSDTIPLHWRVQFERELETLIQYFELADRYIARRSASLGASFKELPSS